MPSLRLIAFAPFLGLLLSSTSTQCHADGLMTTFAGSGKANLGSNTGPASQINIGQPFGVEEGPDGAIYITEVGNHRVLRLDRATKQVTVVAGTGRKGYSGDGGPATNADLNEPYEVRFDKSGNMYFVEMMNHLIRRVDAKTKRISTIAGTGKAGFSGDGGPAIKAQFKNPHSIALDGQGGLYVADIGNHRIRRIDLATGMVDTIAGSKVRRLPVDGQRAKGNPILGPRALYIKDQVMWIALREGHSVWKMDMKSGRLHHIAGSGKRGFSGDGGPLLAATFNGPKGIALGPKGRVFVVDTENQAIRMIDVGASRISTVCGYGPKGVGGAGDGGSPVKAQMGRPHGICVAKDGTVFIGDTNNHRVRGFKID